MIARIWHGTTEAGKADEYVNYLKKTGIPDYRATKGNRGAFILRKIEGGHGAFLYFIVLGFARLDQRIRGRNNKESLYLMSRIIRAQNKWMRCIENEPAETAIKWFDALYKSEELTNLWNASLNEWIGFLSGIEESDLNR